MIPGSSKDHPSFIRSFGYAIEGFVTAVRTERNINVMLFVGALTVIAGLVVGLDLASWCIIAVCCDLLLNLFLVCPKSVWKSSMSHHCTIIPPADKLLTIFLLCIFNTKLSLL